MVYVILFKRDLWFEFGIYIIIYVIVIITEVQNVLNIHKVSFCPFEGIFSKMSVTLKLVCCRRRHLSYIYTYIWSDRISVYEYLHVPLSGYSIINIFHPITLPMTKGRINTWKHLNSHANPFGRVSKGENYFVQLQIITKRAVQKRKRLLLLLVLV